MIVDRDTLKTSVSPKFTCKEMELSTYKKCSDPLPQMGFISRSLFFNHIKEALITQVNLTCPVMCNCHIGSEEIPC